MLGYAVGAFALISLMSALNGFEKVIFKVYDTYYPDIKITANKGKVFEFDSATVVKLTKIKGVEQVAYSLEENAVIQNGENQVVGLVKGVSSNFLKVVKTDSLIIVGEQKLRDVGGPRAWMAEGLYYKLNLGSESRVVNVLSPSRENSGVTQMDMMEEAVRITAVIRPGDEMDQKLMITDLEFAQGLFEREGMVSGIEVKLNSNADVGTVSKFVRTQLGTGFDIRDRRQQNQAVYKMFNTEKWVAFALMAFVLLIISFNLVGSLSMLVLEKKNDIKLLQAVGMSRAKLRQLFFNEGVMVALIGTIAGILVGILVVLLQQKYGFVTTNSTFVSAYPVELRWTDVAIVAALGSALGISAAVYPAWNSSVKD